MKLNNLSEVEVATCARRKEKILNVAFALATVLFYMMFVFVKVYATDPAEQLWGTIAGFIGTWVFRLGGVVLFVGGIMFGLGWKNDDAEGKSRGISTMIAGAIVMGLAGMVDTFFGTGVGGGGVDPD